MHPLTSDDVCMCCSTYHRHVKVVEVPPGRPVGIDILLAVDKGSLVPHARQLVPALVAQAAPRAGEEGDAAGLEESSCGEHGAGQLSVWK